MSLEYWLLWYWLLWYWLPWHGVPWLTLVSVVAVATAGEISRVIRRRAYRRQRGSR